VSSRARQSARHPFKSLVSGLAAVTLAVSGMLLAPAIASAAPPSPGSNAPVSFEDGRYIVTLAASSVATYEGGVSGYPGTSPDEGDQLDARRGPVQDYSEYLVEKQEEVAASAGVTIDAQYTMAIDAFSADLTSDQAARAA